jgi:hypothetical protein
MDTIYIIDNQTESLITIDKDVAQSLNLKPFQRVSRKVAMHAIAVNNHAMLAKVDDMKRHGQAMPAEPSKG